MDAKRLLELILLFVLHFQGNSGRDLFLNKRSGQDAVLSCTSESSSPPTCSIVEWFYYKDGGQAITEVRNGEVIESSARAARLSVTTDCSLVINNVTAEDAGLYFCRQGGDTNTDVNTYLSVLTISPSQPGADPNRDDDITLKCSLFKVRDVPCRENNIRWVDETGAELLGEGDGYRVLPQTACVSFLTVKRQSGRNRKYTCQFVDEQNSVKIEADYTLDPPPNQIYIIIGGVVGAVVVLVVIAGLIIYRKRANVTEDFPKPTQHPDEPESNLTYVTVNHANQQASTGKKVKEEKVMYCTVKCQKTEANEDPSNLYSNVRNLK
ncbi:uncharacterized protein LOC116706123 isoform X2 [Etheostoma spectabile]|nr:uncharacterized protein LOC116706123 isoform X2 [Etheostoma spectabile]XP_032398662.1 uncharacterized protein LOC116706123 isoform X2 [Etheostoma spectabile]XP_032398663.1 uncharacterized protein LOC116706123 isoform X2 [Etheostoma spectabile]XP_032398664.1 uncharacterized protein LOC116706123 isoform X2 [Etheostoma spectabile]